MYNRYIPQPDGTYRRSQVASPPPPPVILPPEPEEIRPPEPETPECRQCIHAPAPKPQPRERPEQGLGGFFRQLLPAGFDAEDLLVVLLLLLMAQDCREDSNLPLLTLALYLFL